jgi:Icc-related predicted phosphoesterase
MPELGSGSWARVLRVKDGWIGTDADMFMTQQPHIPHRRAPAPAAGLVRVAAIGDVHCSPTEQGVLRPLLSQIGSSADILALCGDLTNHGLPDEAHALVRELSILGQMPVVAVLGNHDYESDHVDELCRIFSAAGVTMLDGSGVELFGLTLVGVKGFAGGFDRGTLSAFGEPAMKRFVQEAVDEMKRLESALARVKTEKRVVMMHYSPIRATVEGEPPEIFPFLGCGRFEEPLNRYQVTVCVHGHAHKGAPEGHTKTGVPVYNVALPVMRAAFPNRPPFRVLDIHVKELGVREQVDSTPVETDVG